MNLNDTQKQQVAAWIASGLKLAAIQNRLASEFQIQLTYMQVRMLVDDLKLVPHDPEPSKPPELPMKAVEPQGGMPPVGPKPGTAGQPMESPAPGGISVQVDQLARPGSVVSGKVTFSDGQAAAWYLDELGRLGLAPEQKGYRPAAAEVQRFQAVLETELSKLGY